MSGWQSQRLGVELFSHKTRRSDKHNMLSMVWYYGMENT